MWLSNPEITECHGKAYDTVLYHLNHHHGRFFPQKGTPLAAVLRPSPYGQLEGTPLTDRKRLPPSRLSRKALPPQKTTSPEAHLEPRAEPSAEPRAELLACTWRLEAHAPRDRTFYEAWQPPRRLGNSKRGFLVGRKYFRTCPQTLEPHTTWLQVCVNALFHRFRASKVRFSALSRIVR